MSDRPKLSFGSWAMLFGPFAGDPWTFERVCTYVARAGYDGIEVSGFSPHPHHASHDDRLAVENWTGILADHGLEVSAYAPDLTDNDPASEEADGYLEDLRQSVAMAASLGTSLLRTDTVSPPVAHAPGDYERRFDRLVSTWRRGSDLCAEADLTLLWEFEPGFWLNKPSEVVRLVEAVDHPNFQLLFDTSHARTGAEGSRNTGEPEVLSGGVPEYAALVAEHVGHLHLIDSDGSLHDEETSAHVEFGWGDVDFEATLHALGPVARDLEWWTVDYCFNPDTPELGERAQPVVEAMRDRWLAA